VNRIRVAVANRPRLMRELLLATITDQADIEIVAEIAEEADIARVVEEKTPEFLIIACDAPGQRPVLCDSLLRRHPKMKILALEPEGNRSIFYSASFEIHAMPLEASESGILEALRANCSGARS
jgi:chemotaxis response regulator CheB